MKFNNGLDTHCAFCLERLYGTKDCYCKKSILEKKMNKEIEDKTVSIKEKYKVKYGVYYDNDKIWDYLNKNPKNYPSRDY